jgi:hypothetical protein
MSGSPGSAVPSSVQDWAQRLQQALQQHPLAQQPAAAHLAYCSDLLELQLALLQKLQAELSCTAQQLKAARAEGSQRGASLQQCVAQLRQLLGSCSSAGAPVGLAAGGAGKGLQQETSALLVLAASSVATLQEQDDDSTAARLLEALSHQTDYLVQQHGAMHQQVQEAQSQQRAAQQQLAALQLQLQAAEAAAEAAQQQLESTRATAQQQWSQLRGGVAHLLQHAGKTKAGAEQAVDRVARDAAEKVAALEQQLLGSQQELQATQQLLQAARQELEGSSQKQQGLVEDLKVRYRWLRGRCCACDQLARSLHANGPGAAIDPQVLCRLLRRC